MTHDNNPAQQLSLATRMMIGAAIGLAVISIFVFPAGAGDPAWGKFWMIRPLLLVPFAGAVGGACNFYILRFRGLLGVNRILAIIASVFVFIFGMWMGIVLGLAGTMWN